MTLRDHITGVPCHYIMALPLVMDGRDSLCVWKVAANILSKQPQTTDKGFPSSLAVGHRTDSPGRQMCMVIGSSGRLL
jgi:hypothetical protein